MLSYAARIKKESDGYLVVFPDFKNIATYGLSLQEALANAEEALNGCLESDFERNFRIQEPSRVMGKNVHQIPVAPHIAVAIMLRTLRADRSQMEVAKELKIAYQAYQRLENPRKANPTIKTLEKIARVFGRRVDLGFV